MLMYIYIYLEKKHISLNQWNETSTNYFLNNDTI